MSRPQPEPIDTRRREDDRRALREGFFAAVVLLLVGLIGLLGLHHSAIEAVRSEIHDDLVRIASAAASLVDGDRHRELHDAEQMDGELYDQVIAPLRAVRASTPGVKYVYTAVRDGDVVRFVLDAAVPGDNDGDAREDRAALWEVYADCEPEIWTALGDAQHPGTATASPEPYSDAWGSFMTGYAPFYDRAGRQVGVVGVDITADTFLSRLEHARVMTLLGALPALVVAVIVGFAVWGMRRRALAAQRKILESQEALAGTHRELRELYDRLQKIATQVPGVVYQYKQRPDGTSCFPFASEGIREIYRVAPEEVRESAAAVFAVLHPDDYDGIVASIRRSAATMERWEHEYRVRFPDGTVRWLFGSAVPQREPDGAILWHGFITDSTDRKAAERSLEEAKRAAEAASLAKSEFLANMSHEIRTPLTAILGYAEFLREQGGTAERAPAPSASAPGEPSLRRTEVVDTIQVAGRHLLTIINDILDLSKIEAGRMTVERVETPLPRLLGEVAGMVRRSAQDKGLHVEAVLATPIPERIVGDPTRLRQILMNLAGNAIKFTERGTVTLRASAVDGVWGPRLRIDVEDTGPGMTADEAARLFRPFTQADASVTRRHGGTGLGLTICRRLSRLMDGDIVLLRSEPGRGSCFRLDLPLEPAAGAALVASIDPDAAHAARAAAPAVTTLQGRILLAEDGRDNQRLISLILRRAGAEVDVADDGREALERIEAAEAAGRPYDLLVTDVQMPVMDGCTLARTLRERGHGLGVVALTAHAMAEDRDRCLAAGCDDYASKPIDRAALIATCALWMRRGSGVTPPG